MGKEPKGQLHKHWQPMFAAAAAEAVLAPARTVTALAFAAA
jgi:hypothetical protein